MDNQTKHMLLMAAKAGGVPGTFQSWFDDRDNESYGIAPDGACGRDWWNPLFPSKDALLLAAHLNMMIEVDHYHALANGVTVAVSNGDKCAALCLAITRAAAAIGEAMP